MEYIKFRLSKITDKEGNIIDAHIRRIESSMPSISTYELNLIMHALSHKGGSVELEPENNNKTFAYTFGFTLGG